MIMKIYFKYKVGTNTAHGKIIMRYYVEGKGQKGKGNNYYLMDSTLSIPENEIINDSDIKDKMIESD